MAKDPKNVRQIRKMSAVTQFGVGAIWENQGESLVQMDVSRWEKGHGSEIRLDRLAAHLGKSGFRDPHDDEAGLPFYRFPEWLFCPQCRALERYELERTAEVLRCSCHARAKLLPIRFVGICDAGHLFDIDWAYWAHSEKQSPGVNCRETKLRWEKIEGGIGLDALGVSCPSCGARRSLAGITTAKLRCTGGQPWQAVKDRINCDERTYGVQRGGSNVWYPAVTSALDIPPESDYRDEDAVEPAIKNDPNFRSLVRQEPGGFFEDGLVSQIATQHRVSEATVRSLLARERGGDGNVPGAAGTNLTDLRIGEWLALNGPRTPDIRSRFVIEPLDLTNSGGGGHDHLILRFGKLVAAHRLHEVRALRGFTRVNPESDNQSLVPSSFDDSITWLPAYEVYGEGIFFSLDEERLKEWETRPQVRTLVHEISGNARHRLVDLGEVSLATPRLYLLHTLSHLLLRQLSFDCGYPSPSLRERIYVTHRDSDIDMAGVLIYTADSDAEGSMGGLARQARPENFFLTLSRALDHSRWCSLDPVCSETTSGTDGSNRASCHACTLAPETSCEIFNLRLCRSLVMGPDRSVSFF